jgi:hypothetical protein
MIMACLGLLDGDLGEPASRIPFSSGALFARRNSSSASFSVLEVELGVLAFVLTAAALEFNLAVARLFAALALDRDARLNGKIHNQSS